MDGEKYGSRCAWGGRCEGPERSPAQAGVWSGKVGQGVLSGRDTGELGLEGWVRLRSVMKEGKGLLGRENNMSSGTEDLNNMTLWGILSISGMTRDQVGTEAFCFQIPCSRWTGIYPTFLEESDPVVLFRKPFFPHYFLCLLYS